MLAAFTFTRTTWDSTEFALPAKSMRSPCSTDRALRGCFEALQDVRGWVIPR
jgi:hypothetical protein